MKYSREEAIDKVRSFVETLPEIEAVWEGGSSATGYLDSYSDLDMYIVSKNEHHENLMATIIAFIDKTFGIERKYRLPEPTPHGFRQAFVKTVNTPELFYIDFVIMDVDTDDKYLETNRHGNAILWKDKLGLSLDERPDRKSFELCKRIYKSTVDRDFILMIELEKQIKRNNYLEAFPLYMSFISRCLVSLYNIKYRPEKVDFGMRYIYRDFPEMIASGIENALKVNDLQELNEHYLQFKADYFALVVELKEAYQR